MCRDPESWARALGERVTADQHPISVLKLCCVVSHPVSENHTLLSTARLPRGPQASESVRKTLLTRTSAAGPLSVLRFDVFL